MRIRAALLILFGLGLVSLPTAASAAAYTQGPEQCKEISCVWMSVAPSPTGWGVHVRIRMRHDAGFEFYNVRIPGQSQMKADGPGNQVDLDVQMAPGWDGTIGVQACRGGTFSSDCQN